MLMGVGSCEGSGKRGWSSKEAGGWYERALMKALETDLALKSS